MKQAKCVVNQEKIKENFNYYSNIKKVICVVKSNGYGCNLVKIVKSLIANGASCFAVFTIKEAMKIRKISTNCFILILNSIEKKDLAKCYKNNFTISINSLKDYLIIKNSNIQVQCHIKIDTGMHRFGVTPIEFKKIINEHKIKINGIFSHLVGGKNNLEYIKKQIDLFDKTIEDIDLSSYLIHICSTFSCEIVKSRFQNAIRIGIGIYGFGPYLNPAIELNLPIILKREIAQNEYCSYDCSFLAKENGYLYLTPLGYYNTFLPTTKIEFQNFINAGKICMNCLLLFSKNNYQKKVITISGYDLLKIANDNNLSIYWVLSSFTS